MYEQKRLKTKERLYSLVRRVKKQKIEEPWETTPQSPKDKKLQPIQMLRSSEGSRPRMEGTKEFSQVERRTGDHEHHSFEKRQPHDIKRGRIFHGDESRKESYCRVN